MNVIKAKLNCDLIDFSMFYKYILVFIEHGSFDEVHNIFYDIFL